MKSVKLQDTINDFNFHIVHVGETPPEVKWVNILKAREGGGKIQGVKWDEVYIDELV